MSPEVFLSASVMWCRLVQNAGEFVVSSQELITRGFYCGHAAVIATTEWLSVAKEAAIRSAAIRCPPMVSHFQLSYDLALSLCSRPSFSCHLLAPFRKLTQSSYFNETLLGQLQ
ncbi:UNVERIFIED_CONTAM: Lysine-specific demethylase [Sesamum calycinum]|uniref:Lysine-specific demethylase n=1 Tax=Sesamum calycinum TaxID=2727403 RepID=A0AAW2KVL1_9LAMI